MRCDMSSSEVRLENQLCFPLYACSKEIVRKYKPYLDPLELTYTQYIALMVLWGEGRVTVKEMGKKLYLDSGTLTPLLKRLEEKGYVERMRDKDDNRNVYITLTDEGRRLEAHAADIQNEIGTCLPLGADDMIDLYRILNTLLAFFADER